MTDGHGEEADDGDVVDGHADELAVVERVHVDGARAPHDEGPECEQRALVDVEGAVPVVGEVVRAEPILIGVDHIVLRHHLQTGRQM